MMRTLSAIALSLLLVAGSSDAANFAPSLQTTGAAVTDIGGGVIIPEDSVCSVVLRTIGSNHTGGSAMWTWRVAARRLGSDPVQTFFNPADVVKSPAATAWNATLVEGSHFIGGQVQGGIGQTVDWVFTNEEPFCMAGPFVP